MPKSKAKRGASAKKSSAKGGKARAAKTPLVAKQPALKQAAALQAHIFLQTNDKWSLAYFDPKDLHSKERELFG
jgi:hypothetical protein